MPRWKMNGAGLAAWALLALSLLLAGCTVPEWQKPGTPRSEIERSMGRPTLSLPLDGGGTRLVYSRQPATSGPTVSWKMAFAARPMCT
jgi:hypothetical protein